MAVLSRHSIPNVPAAFRVFQAQPDSFVFHCYEQTKVIPVPTKTGIEMPFEWEGVLGHAFCLDPTMDRPDTPHARERVSNNRGRILVILAPHCPRELGLGLEGSSWHDH